MLIPGSSQPAALPLSTAQPLARAISLDDPGLKALPSFAQEASAAIALSPEDMLGSGKAIDLEFRQHRDAAGKNNAEDEASQRERISSTAKDMEAMLLGTMLKQVWQSLENDPLFGGDRASSIYREMWLDETCKNIAGGPNALGIGRLVEQDLLRNAGLDKPRVESEQEEDEQGDKPASWPDVTRPAPHSQRREVISAEGASMVRPLEPSPNRAEAAALPGVLIAVNVQAPARRR